MIVLSENPEEAEAITEAVLWRETVQIASMFLQENSGKPHNLFNKLHR